MKIVRPTIRRLHLLPAEGEARESRGILASGSERSDMRLKAGLNVQVPETTGGVLAHRPQLGRDVARRTLDAQVRVCGEEGRIVMVRRGGGASGVAPDAEVGYDLGGAADEAAKDGDVLGNSYARNERHRSKKRKP